MSTSSPSEVDGPSVEEYVSQLEEIETLLRESPNDATLLQLRADLFELIQLSTVSGSCSNSSSIRSTYETDRDRTAAAINDDSKGDSDSASLFVRKGVAAATSKSTVTHTKVTSMNAPSTSATPTTTADSTLLSSTFEIPYHLTPLPSDTEAERQKKRRAIKALKTKFKMKQKTVESQAKQKNWQDFMKKNKGGTSQTSIFQTKDYK